MIDLEEKKEILRESGMEETVKVPSNAIQVNLDLLGLILFRMALHVFNSMKRQIT